MPDTEIAPPGDTQLGRVFVGPEGLRAGWRLLVFLAILAVLGLASSPLQNRLVRSFGSDFSAPNVILSEFLTFTVVLIATAIMGRMEHRGIADYGLPWRQMLGKQFWAGALWGFAMLTVIVVLMMATHAYSLGSLALSPVGVVKYGLLWAVAFLMVGLFEEFAFRGYLQFTLTTGMGFWPAAAVTCICFAMAHLQNPGENWIGVVEIVLIAFFLCMALRRTGSLWFAIGWHMAFDWGESFFYSTPNSGISATGHMLNASLMGSKWLSGGSVGPEASVFDLVVTIGGILLLAKLYPEAKYPPYKPTASEPAAFLPDAGPRAAIVGGTNPTE